MGTGVLADIARDLVKSLRRDVTTDWVSRDDVRAKLRSTIKRLLARHGYPPDAQPAATELVLRQMETFAEEWSPEASHDPTCSQSRWPSSVGGFGRGVTDGRELENLGRGSDLRFGWLEDCAAPWRLPGGECLAEVAPVGVFAGNLEALAFFELLVERLALGGQAADEVGHLADPLVRGQVQLRTFGIADRAGSMERSGWIR